MSKAVIFIHIPKTAGTSIATIARSAGIIVKDHDIRNSKFRHLSEMNESIFKDYLLFTVVRNPWDRVLSAFLYLNSGGRNENDKLDKKKFLSKYNGNFKAFVKEAFLSKNILEQLHFIPQHKWICSAEEKILLDNILKFENLQSEMNMLLNKIGLQSIQLPHINRTEHRHYTSYYDDYTIDIIANVYKKDISLFNYNFKNLDK